MYKKQVIAVLFVAVLLILIACTPQQPERIIVTVVIKITATPRPPEPPAPTTWVGVIHCPECDGLALSLWQKIDDIGFPEGKVHHGDTCVVIDQGVTDGIKKYKLNCMGKYGWLRAEGVVPK